MALNTIFKRLKDRLLPIGTSSGAKPRYWDVARVYDRPFPMLVEKDAGGISFDLERAIIEEIQNHIDAALDSGTDCDIIKYNEGKIKDVWVIRDSGSGFGHKHIRTGHTTKRRENVTKLDLERRCMIGFNGTGMRKSGFLLTHEGATVVHKSLDWMGQFKIIQEDEDDDGTNKLEMLGVEVISGLKNRLTGSETTLYNLPREAERIIEHPEKHFLYFKEKREQWQPLYIERGQWNSRGIDCVVGRARTVGRASLGEVWVQGANVCTRDILFDYNFNSIRAPRDDNRKYVAKEDLRKGIRRIITTCIDDNVIDHVIARAQMPDEERSINTEGDRSTLEWETLGKLAGGFSRLRRKYKERFYKIFKQTGKKRNPVLRNKFSTQSKVRVDRALKVLDVDVIDVNHDLAMFLHSCGVEYDTELLETHEDLLLQPAELLRTRDGESLRYVDDIVIARPEYELKARQRAYALIEYARKFSPERPAFQFLISNEGGEAYFSLDDYHRVRHFADHGKELNTSSEYAQQVHNDLFGLPGHMQLSLPKKIGSYTDYSGLCTIGTNTGHYFRDVKGVRIDIPVPGGLEIIDIGELSSTRGKADEVYKVKGQRERTPEQINAGALVNKVMGSCAAQGGGASIRSGTILAGSKKIKYGRRERLTIEAFVGLEEEESLRDRAAVTLTLPTDQRELREFLSVFYNLESHVLHHRSGYRPIAAKDDCELVSIDDDHRHVLFKNGYLLAKNKDFLFSYNYINPKWEFGYEYIPANMPILARRVMIESQNIEVYEKLIRSSGGHDDKRTRLHEHEDYVHLAATGQVSLRDRTIALLKQAFENVYDKKTVIASDEEIKEGGKVHKDHSRVKVTRNDGSNHIVDYDALRAGSRGYAEIARDMGYTVVTLRSGIARTLKHCGVKDDISVVAQGCTYIEVRDGGSSGSGGGSGSGESSEPKESPDSTPKKDPPSDDITSRFTPEERIALGAARETAKLISEETGLEYEVRIFSGIKNKDGVELPTYFTYSKIQEGDKHIVYVRRDQLHDPNDLGRRSERLSSIINNIIEVSVSMKQGHEMAMKDLYMKIIGKTIGEYGKLRRAEEGQIRLE